MKSISQQFKESVETLELKLLFCNGKEDEKTLEERIKRIFLSICDNEIERLEERIKELELLLGTHTTFELEDKLEILKEQLSYWTSERELIANYK